MSKHIPAITLLAVGIVSGLSSVASSVSAQDTQQDYTDFQNCLSGVEVDGVVTEQQILDCLDSTYSDSAGERDGSSDGSQEDSNDAGSE